MADTAACPVPCATCNGRRVIDYYFCGKPVASINCPDCTTLDNTDSP